MKFMEDKNAGKINIPKITTEDAKDIKIENVKPKKEIIPGTKVRVKGRPGTFSVSQILVDGKVSLLGPNGLILKVEQENII